MSEDISPVSKLLGRLEMAVETLTKTWAAQDLKATEGRHDLYNKFGELQREFTALSSDVKILGTQVAEIRPTVRAGEHAQLRALGGWKLLKLLGYILAVLAGAFGNQIVELFRLGHKTP